MSQTETKGKVNCIFKLGCKICGQLTTQKCGGCRNVAYCSIECQRKDRETHKQFCYKDADPKFRSLSSRKNPMTSYQERFPDAWKKIVEEIKAKMIVKHADLSRVAVFHELDSNGKVYWKTAEEIKEYVTFKPGAVAQLLNTRLDDQVCLLVVLKTGNGYYARVRIVSHDSSSQ